MKRIFTLLLLLTTFSISGISQNSKINYTKDSRWFFGINGGATWHTKTEVDNIIKGGYGFTFGRSFGMRPEKLFSWDLRLRYLHGFWGGQATSQYTLDSTTNIPSGYSNNLQQYQDSTGYFIPNFRTELLSGSLELALNTNRLRENTGWNIQIFGGIGIKAYNSKADLFDNNGNIYDYSNTSLNKPALLAQQDGNYETYVTGSDADYQVDWMPSFGAGISYQLAPWVSIGISHKMTWTRSNDLFDLNPNNTTGQNTGKNDIYHYSSAGFKFHLFGGDHSQPIDDDPIDDDTTDIMDNTNNNNVVPVVDNTPKQKPIVDIYDPGSSPYTTELAQFIIKANVHYVNGKQNVTFKQNGNINNNFSYNATSDKFASTVILQPGQNIFEITGVNDAGQDYESTIIIYKRDEPKPEPPIVTITNPPYSPYTTANGIFNLASTVLNVDSKSQIKVYFNGINLTNFSYSTSTKNLGATLNLSEGTNTVTVTGTNAVGSDSKTVKIIYTKPEQVQPPIVNFIFPSVDPYGTSQQAIHITASVLNVTSKSNITVTVNGNNFSNFNYNSNNKHVDFNMNLISGANIIEITGTNQAGSDYESTTIIYKRPEVPQPPIVTFLDPISDPTVVYNPNYNVRAKVLYVAGASDITLKINGIQSYNFSYSSSSKEMSFTTNLVQGSNVVEITGTNQFGQDLETTTIIYKKTIQQAPPVVNITYPAQDNQVFNTQYINLIASVLNVNSANNISVLVNGNQTNSFTYNTSTKVLNLPLVLVEGVNTVKITGSNTAGTDSDTRLIIYKKPIVAAPPTVSYVNPPTTPHLVTVENFTMTANTTNINSKSQISLFFNGALINDALYTFNSSNQIIYSSVLIEGNNVFDIVVTNNDGTADAMAIVTYQKDETPCLIPTVGYIHPVPYSTVNDPNVTIDAQINNHSPETVVELFVNGASQGFMVYNAGTSIASKATILSPGSNSVKVMVTNLCGQNQATFTLNYVEPAAPCIDPTIIAFSTTTFTTQGTTATVQAGVTNISGASAVTATLNGQPVTVVYDPGTGAVAIVDANLTLGNNTIIITAVNDCGTATLTYHILREECFLPTIGSITPANNTTTADLNLTLSAQLTNVTASDIQFIVNGISQTFTFNSQTGAFAASINLQDGPNQLSIVATNSCGSKTETFTYIHEIPCTPLSVNLLTPATSPVIVTNANYAILLHANGTLEASGIVTTFNGANVNSIFDPIAGTIAINNLTLVDGSNSVVVTLTNDCSSETVNYTINYDGCQEPTIATNGITTGSVVNQSTLNLSSVITNSNGAGNITLNVNGQSESFNFDDLTGVLTAAINLQEGSNIIILTVDGCQVATETINITYEVPCSVISYSLMQPAALTGTVVVPNYSISLNIQELIGSQQISVKLNGSSIPFTYDPASHILSALNITLIDGANTIEVNATNDCSSETITYAIQYNGCQAPVITMASTGTTASASAYSVSGTVTNLAIQSDLQILLNGAPATIVFDPQTGSFSSDLILVEGSNTIVVNANGCASDTETITVVYTIPCDPIVFALSTPSQLTTSTADEIFVLNVVAQYATANSISVNHNGSVVSHTYSNDLITSNLTLIDGANTVIVTMSNACSSETLTFNIQHDGCDAPIIDLSANADASTQATFNFVATVTNVDNQGQIVFTQNGNNVPFVYNGITHELTALITLTEGANAIVLTANGCVTSTDNYTITYTIPCVDVSYSLASPSQLSTVVNGATTTITLNVQNVVASSDITATLNGASAQFTFVNGLITLLNVPLIDGPNLVSITFSNNCSSETLTYAIESDQCDAPIITLSNSSINSSTAAYPFTCNVTNIANASDLGVTLNGQNVSSSLSTTGGILTAQLTLVEGTNIIVVTANGCDTVSATLTIDYQIPCNPITYSHVVPSSTDSVTVSSATYLVKMNTTNVEQANISVTLNGATIPSLFANGLLIINTSALVLGVNTIVVDMTNDCSQAQAIYHITYEPAAPACDPPVITLGQMNATTNSSNFNYTAGITNASSQNIILTFNGVNLPFTYTNGQLTAPVTLIEGTNVFSLEVNECQNALNTWSTNYTPPCNNLTFSQVSPTGLTNNTDSAYYSITISTTEVSDQSMVTSTVNGTSHPAILASNGTITISGISLNDGANTVLVNFGNACSNQMLEYVITYTAPAPQPCGPRFNPGNSDWQFCLVTPTGTYNRDDLANNANFTYQGVASAVYFKPIAGGGDAIVNGQPYSVQNGQYYLFQGNLTVDVSSSHPGSMGHWEICVTSDANPTYGNGNNRPESPCEVVPVDDFTIDPNGTVNVTNNSCTTIKCLGESVVYNNSQDAFVSVQYSIDGGNNYFFLNGGNHVNGGEQTTVATPAGSEVVIKSVCVNENGGWSNTEISNLGSQYVYVLKNGDQAPNFAPAQGQAGVETFLAGLVDASGNVTIGPNDVIYLFELRFVGNYGIDYQDCVMLITVDDNGTCSAPTDPVPPGSKSAGQVYQKPEFNNIAPKNINSAYTNAANSYDFKVKVTNVGEKNDLKVNLNGSSIPAFNYDMKSQVLSTNLKLREGVNTVRIDAANGNKNAIMTYNITYSTGVVAPAVLQPTITSISPSRTTETTESGTYSFKAKVENISSKSDIKLLVNGAPSNAFIYSSSTKEVSAVIKLNKGSNSIKLIATNQDKKAERTYSIEFKEKATPINTDGTNDGTSRPSVAPVITNINPLTTSSTSNTSTYSFKAKVTNISSKANIGLKLNGASVTNFTYSSSTNQVTAILRLKTGNNTINLDATNGDKKASRTYTISFTDKTTPVNTNDGGSRPSVAPIITNINPSATTGTSSASTYSFKAKVTNVGSKSNIQLKLNGANVTNFTYSSSTNQVTAILRLKTGSNSINLDATNGDKKASRAYSIEYKTGTTQVIGTNQPDNTTKPVTVVTPTITNVSPSGRSVSTKAPSYLFKARLKNVKSKSDITITLNGRSYTAFNYNTGSGEVSASVGLVKGANSIKITVKNGTKTATSSYTITYTPPTTSTPDNKGGGTTNSNKGGGTTNSTKGGGTTNSTKGGGTNNNRGGGH